MRIAIIGAGIGGLTAAFCFSRSGHQITVFERASALAEVGAGIQLGPNAMQVMGALGLSDKLCQVGFKPHALALKDAQSGRDVFRLPAGKAMQARFGAPYLHVHRADLVNVLSETVAADPNVTISLGKTVVSISQTGEAVTVVSEDGAGAEFDCLIGADGMRSVVRSSLHGSTSPRFSGFGAWRVTVSVDSDLRALIPPDATVWGGSDRHAVTYYLREGKLLNFVGVVPRSEPDQESWTQPGDLLELKRDFAGFVPAIRSVIDRAVPENLFTWALFDRLPLSRWGVGRVTLLGDAAHPMPPFFAQGAGMAIEDAWVLARALSAEADLCVALRTYEASRAQRTAKVQSAAWRNLDIFHRARSARSPFMRFGAALASRALPALLRRQTDWIYNWKP